MPNQRLLEGEVVENNGDDSEMNRLRELNRGLTRELHDALDENDRLRKRVAQADAPLARLREKLEPFYQLLQAVFGDIEDIAPEAQPSGARAAPNLSPVWESWKSRLGVTAAKIITALQGHGELNTQQLSIVTGLHRTTIPKGIYALNKAGLLNKNAGRFSLKPLG